MQPQEVKKRFDPLGSDEEIMETVTYHRPEPEQIEAFAQIQAAAANFLRALREHVPGCADRSAALRCLREARMWANSAIAMKGKI